jgi:hypothetical protein
MNLLKRYEGNKIARTLIHLLPGGIGSAIDANIDLRIKEFKEKKTENFFDQLHERLSHSSLELIDSDDFLHCYFITIRSVLNAGYFGHIVPPISLHIVPLSMSDIRGLAFGTIHFFMTHILSFYISFQ